MKKYNWKLKDVLMVGLISVLFAVIYLGTVYLASFLTTALTPFGLSVFGNEIVFGIWFMAATFAAYVIQKPGVAIVAEMLAALIEVLMGNFYGPIVFVSGFLQGAGAEFGFAVYKYKRFDFRSMCLAALGATVTSFIWGFFRSGFFNLNPGLLCVMFIVRLCSSLLFCTVGCKLFADGLAKAGVLKGYALGAKQDIDFEDEDLCLQ